MGVTLFRNRDAGRAVKVISISDGYTFTGLDSQNRQVKVRLHGIDAPEKAQAFGNVARKALGDLIEGKTVEVQQVDKDRYGRVVANVHIGGTHVNRVACLGIPGPVGMKVARIGNPDPGVMKVNAPSGEETFDDVETTEEAQAGADRREVA